jgi:poly-gamma-glutamate capsule biosynthesis protein CapA/YwtB (metallophosphatase superfamily)
MMTVVLSLVLSSAPEMTMLVAGDVTLGYHYQEFVDEQVSKGRPRDEMIAWGFDQVRNLTKDADVFVVNLECPFTEHAQKIAKNFNFKARPELVAALLSGGVDVVSLANNHMLDYGPEGLFDTLNTLDTHGVAHFGAGRSLSAAREPALVKRNGLTVAFLGYFFLGDRNIEPPEVIALEGQPGVAGHFNDITALRKMMEVDIKAARKKADHVIPYFHWGREGFSTVEPYQTELAHLAIDLGASAVIGSHPHVLQGIELYRGKVIAYSLGNFVFGGNWNPKDKRTALLELSITKTAISVTRVIPAFSDAYPEVPVQPFVASGDQADATLKHLSAISRGFRATIPQLMNQEPAPDAMRPDAGP